MDDLLLTDKDYMRLVKYIPTLEHDLRKVAQAQLDHSKPLIEKRERERIFKEIETELVESDSRNMWYLNKRFWQVLKEGK